MEPTPYLRNRRTNVVLPYNEHLAKHPDMYPCEELPYAKKAQKPVKPVNKRNAAKPKAEPAGDAEIDDLLAGIDHG